MNWLNVSHQTMTVVYFDGLTPGGTLTRKLSNVLTSPTSAIRCDQNRQQVNSDSKPDRSDKAMRSQQKENVSCLHGMKLRDLFVTSEMTGGQ